jgi:hypothetical protein
MSIVRVGLAETKNFSEGYDLIFGKKKEDKQEQAEKTEQSSAAKQAEQTEQQKK